MYTNGMANRRVGSFAAELIKKAQEAMLTAVQIFNNPHVEFKAELFIVTSTIAWTYLIHAYFHKKKIEYRRFTQLGKRRRFEKTKHGAYWNLSLWECLDHGDCPLDESVRRNLRFLIGIRNEIEHQMTTRIDDHLSAKFQASALNFNSCIKALFGNKHSLDSEQAFSIQFCGINEAAAKHLMAQTDLPDHIQSFISQFENGLTDEQFNDPRFSYRVFFTRKTSNTKTGADSILQFLPADSAVATEVNKVFLRETEKTKYLAKSIVKQMKDEGFDWFSVHQHTKLWQSTDAKNPKYQFGTVVVGTWYWYESWVSEVQKHCTQQAVAPGPSA